MQKSTEKAIAIILIIGIIVCLAVFFLQNSNSYKFSYLKEEVLFASNAAEPAELMRSFNLSDTVFVSPEIIDGAAGSNLVSNAFNLVQVVFIGNDKNTVSLWRVVLADGKLSYCRTNNGNISQDIQLTAVACQKILDDKNNAIVLVSLPEKEKKNKIIFSENRIEIVPDSIDNLGKTCHIFLKVMYANADLIINKTNSLTGLVK